MTTAPTAVTRPALVGGARAVAAVSLCPGALSRSCSGDRQGTATPAPHCRINTKRPAAGRSPAPLGAGSRISANKKNESAPSAPQLAAVVGTLSPSNGSARVANFLPSQALPLAKKRGQEWSLQKQPNIPKA